jgi:hypothetical protein
MVQCRTVISPSLQRMPPPDLSARLPVMKQPDSLAPCLTKAPPAAAAALFPEIVQPSRMPRARQ